MKPLEIRYVFSNQVTGFRNLIWLEFSFSFLKVSKDFFLNKKKSSSGGSRAVFEA